jgi:imidazole glycerol-phosphate synthase subunit HisF
MHMLKTRVIPCLLLKGTGLVKTVRFKNPTYIGDPINAVKIFNDKEVDELVFLDISATPEKRSPNVKFIADIASEAFMPFGYGGGIKTLNDIEQLFKIGVEKVILNTIAFTTPQLVTEASSIFGNQSIVVAIDVKSNNWGKPEVWTSCGKFNTKKPPAEYARRMQDLGAGEILLNSIDRDGTMNGYDIDMIKSVTAKIEIPLVASGGAGNLQDFRAAITEGGASAASAGSIFVFQGIHRAVLITYPEQKELENLFE